MPDLPILASFSNATCETYSSQRNFLSTISHCFSSIKQHTYQFIKHASYYIYGCFHINFQQDSCVGKLPLPLGFGNICMASIAPLRSQTWSLILLVLVTITCNYLNFLLNSIRDIYILICILYLKCAIRPPFWQNQALLRVGSKFQKKPFHNPILFSSL